MRSIDPVDFVIFADIVIAVAVTILAIIEYSK